MADDRLGRVLIVDDDPQLLDTVCLLLESANYAVRGVATPEEGLQEIRDGQYDVLLVDLVLPGMDGIRVLGKALLIDESLICIVITGHGSVPDAVRAMRSGAFDFVLKPFTGKTLLPVLERAMVVRRLRLDNAQLRTAILAHELSVEATSSSETAVILERTAEAAMRQLGADEISILTPSADGKGLEIVVEIGTPPRNLIGRRIGLESGIAGWAARHQEMLILEGDVRDVRFVPLHPRPEIRAAIVAPLVADGNLVGVLTANFTQSKRDLSPGQRKALGTLTSVAATALHKAALLHNLRSADAQARRANAELERRVAERTAELETANAELESFAYSVSHDLRAPLRTIVSFSDMILEDHGAKLDPEGLDWLRRVRASGRRMSELIDALLSLSQIGRREIHRESVDLSALAIAIIESLRGGDPGREVDVVVRSGIEAHGDQSLLRVVLENFLSNAWKFTRGRSNARIEFGIATEAGGTCWFFVRDNGVGFSMDYADRLFRPFQRIHGSNEFPGHGIGLATVARIVKQHGGAIRAKGREGAGAVFSFTLGAPAAEPEP